MTALLEPPDSAFKQVIAASSEHDVHLLVGRHYAGHDAWVRVQQVRPATWIALVALDSDWKATA